MTGTCTSYNSQKSKKTATTAEVRLNALPVLSPQKINDCLDEFGYHGQNEARRSVCLNAYRHVKRLKSLHVKKIPCHLLPQHSNAILIGPTGCGKSYIIELIFGKILKLPYVIVEMTRFAETGYVGDDVLNILTRLLESANGDLVLAECGVVALDEFDKIAGSNSNARFAGQGTTKDVSGYGVQRELLKMVEGADIQIPLDYGFSNRGSRSVMSTRNITFFALGAFTGFKDVERSGRSGIGFNKNAEKEERIAYKLSEEEAEDIGGFQTYGFIPELIARFNRITLFQPLDAATLTKILCNKLEKYKVEFNEEGFELQVNNNVFDFLVKEALKKRTGARALDSAIMKYLEGVCFECFGQGRIGTVTLRLGKGKLQAEVKIRA